MARRMAQTQRWPMACRGQQAGRVAAAWAEHRPWPPWLEASHKWLQGRGAPLRGLATKLAQ
eukprot:8605359-Lingulodinium_polyedra.AAC.1